MPRGGKRPGAGRQKGSKDKKPSASKLEKEAARVVVREMVFKQLGPMVSAQVANAVGIKYLVTRDKKSGKFIRVTEAMAKAKLASNEEIIEVWEKDPSTPAFTDLMNRALDKPAEQPQQITLTGALELVPARLMAARKRLAESRRPD